MTPPSLGTSEIRSQHARPAQVHVPNRGAIARRLHVKQHADAVAERARHRDLHRAQEWHVVPSQLARSMGGELAREVRRQCEDGADNVRQRELVLPDELLKEVGRGGANFRWRVGVDGGRAADGT